MEMTKQDKILYDAMKDSRNRHYEETEEQAILYFTNGKIEAVLKTEKGKFFKDLHPKIQSLYLA